jgi:hypothetical protein
MDGQLAPDRQQQPQHQGDGDGGASSSSLRRASSDDNNDNPAGPGMAGTKRPVSRVGKDGEPLSEKKLRRLEKNRLSARECRRRKKEATEVMERQINLLEGENLRLRLQLQVRASGCPRERVRVDAVSMRRKNK